MAIKKNKTQQKSTSDQSKNVDSFGINFIKIINDERFKFIFGIIF